MVALQLILSVLLSLLRSELGDAACVTTIKFANGPACNQDSVFFELEADVCRRLPVPLDGSDNMYFKPQSGSCLSPGLSNQVADLYGPYNDSECTTLFDQYEPGDLINNPCDDWPRTPYPESFLTEYRKYSVTCAPNPDCDPNDSPPPPPPPKPYPPPPSRPPNDPSCPDCDDPCFDAATTTVCRVTDQLVDPAWAFCTCFEANETTAADAQRVQMHTLRAGDYVLDGPHSIARVVVNQHMHSTTMSQILHLEHSAGALSVTLDHILVVDREFRPARSVRVGSYLGGFEVKRVTVGRGRVVNPITTSGLVMAANTSGQPVVAATGNEWLSDWMLSTYPQYTLSYALSDWYPEKVQQYYNDVLEPFFSVSVPFLSAAKLSVWTPVVGFALVLGDMLLATGFALYCTSPGLTMVQLTSFMMGLLILGIAKRFMCGSERSKA